MDNNLEQYIKDSFQTALVRGDIRPYYQPVIRTISRKLCSFEALARWEDPEHGMIRPDQFIPVLEQCGRIHQLDCHIIRCVCEQMRKSMETGELPIPVSVNLSRLDFRLCDIFSIVDGIASEFQIPHDFLYIEITESVMVEELETVHTAVEQFRSAGYQVWMDDFGSGYSSLNVLKDFDFDEIKLDMAFLSRFDQRARRILSFLVQMAKEIDIHTLAEGVETQDQVDFLRNIGCEKLQGYFYGEPRPYEDSKAEMRAKGISIEEPHDRSYYDEIGKVNFLSAVPFMSRVEKDSLTTARQLNSIPLLSLEVSGDVFSVLFYNTAFEKVAANVGIDSIAFSQETLRVPQPLSLLPARLLNLMDSTRSGDMGTMYFIAGDEYYQIQAKCVASAQASYCVLLQMNNLSSEYRLGQTELLDNELREIYSLFDRITMIDTVSDTINPLFMSTREDLLSGREGIRALAEEYAQKWIFPEDRAAYLSFLEFDTLEDRLQQAGAPSVSRYLRSNVRHGEYAWKKYTLLRVRQGVYVELICNVHKDLIDFEKEHGSVFGINGPGGVSDAQLWNDLIQSDIVRLFWKDRERRFIGASRGFLDYYGFTSVEEIRGKTDEDLGWHVYPDAYMNDELRVIREGVSTHNVPGHCISNGENREIVASKTPLYNENGEVSGLMGCFIDRDLLNRNDVRGRETERRDLLTGLLNDRGIQEEAWHFRDSYDLRNIDFVRIHVRIDDFGALCRQYGYEFGDKILQTLGRMLKKEFGLTAAVGRHTGHEFVILRQVHGQCESDVLCAWIGRIASGIRRIDSVPLTLYLTVKSALYSECEDLEEQRRRVEITKQG